MELKETIGEQRYKELNFGKKEYFVYIQLCKEM